MDRNFFRRVELGFPVLDAKLKARVINEGLKVQPARQRSRLADGRHRALRQTGGPARSGTTANSICSIS